MPRTMGPIQRIRPAKQQPRLVNAQAPKASMQAPGTQVPGAVRVNVSGRTYQVAPGTGTNIPGTRSGTMSPTTQAAASTACCCSACTGLECLDRTRFFSGQLLTEADLNNEQSYLLAKNRLHNRYLFGCGVVCGLQVSCSDCPGWVTINPGYAIDCCGNDIIVCAAQSFNVLQAIQACAPQQPSTDCSPLRYRPVANCQDMAQTWCITIQYQEQPSRMVTPLQPVGTGTSGCGCGCSGSSSGCGCGCGGSAKTKSSGCGCGGNGGSGSASSSCASASTSSSTAGCQPTRILEGFQLGVCQSPSQEQELGPQPGTFAYQFEQCHQPLYALSLAKPTLVDANHNNLSDQQAYQATCQYLTSATNAIASSYVTHCDLEIGLNQITIPQPPQDTDYHQLLLDKIALIADILLAAAFDCHCSSLLPPCPPDPCDSRLILACVTVQNGAITNICHFGGGRKQVVTFPALYYWLSVFNLDKKLNSLGRVLEQMCCGEGDQRNQLFKVDFSQQEVLLSGSGGNPAMVNRAMMAYVADKLGAAMVNSASPNANAVDLRPLVGLDTQKVMAMLECYRITKETITPIDVSTLPEWTDAAIAAGASYAPAAFKATAPLTMYTRGNLVVGFDVTSPTDVLSAQVKQLQQQLDNLNTQMVAMQTPATAPKKK